MQCPFLNCGILVKAVVVVLMVCSLSSFPRPQPQCSPYKTSPRVCAYEKHRTACAVQCMCTRERLCVCNGGGGEPPRPLLHLSPKLHLPPLHHQVVGVGADVPCAGFFAGSNQGKARAQKEMVVSAKIFAKSRPGFCCVIPCGTVLFEYLFCNKNYNQHLIIDTSLTCVGSGARWGGVCYSILVEKHW